MSEVVAGFFSFTEVTGGQHRAYNEWHQLDHLPEQLPLDGITFGQRWVCSPRCHAARTATSDLLDATHYVTLYLMTDPLADTLDRFVELARELRVQDRFFEHRRALLSGPFAVEARAVAPPVSMSVEALPHRPARGVHVTVEPAAEIDAAGAAARASEMASVGGVAGVWTFGPAAVDHPRWQPGAHRITVAFVEADPIETSDRLGAMARPSAVYAGPFERIEPWQWDWFDS